MVWPKLHLIFPGHEANVALHEKIDRKKELLYKDELPASVLEELAIEVIQLTAQRQGQEGNTGALPVWYPAAGFPCKTPPGYMSIRSAS